MSKVKKNIEAPDAAFAEDSAESKDFENKYLRALADYQNLSKQHLKDKQDFAKYANEGLLMDLLPVYDHLKMSLPASPSLGGEHAVETDKWLEGVKHVLNQFKKVLSEAGVAEIATVGKKFDHNLMDAVASEETAEENQDELVAKELKAGYTLNGKVIIPARVAVYKFTK
jgi:molecular chaperone GrpE